MRHEERRMGIKVKREGRTEKRSGGGGEKGPKRKGRKREKRSREDRMGRKGGKGRRWQMECVCVWGGCLVDKAHCRH